MYFLPVFLAVLTATHASPHHGATLCEHDDGSGKCCHVLPGEYEYPYINNHGCPGNDQTSYIFVDYGCSVTIYQHTIATNANANGWKATLNVPGVNLPTALQPPTYYITQTSVSSWVNDDLTSLKVTCDWIPQNCDWGVAYHSGNMINANAAANDEQECRQACQNDDDCKYWDWDGSGHCRLRDTAGPAGAVEDQGYWSGTAECEFICEEGLGFHSGTQVDYTSYMTHPPANNALDCRGYCQSTSQCEYWDRDGSYCRLRSNAGPEGLKKHPQGAEPYHAAGHQDCKFRGSRDAFTIVFISDLENNYRGHESDGAKMILQDIIDETGSYDSLYADHQIDPQLVVHGGDINRDLWEKPAWGGQMDDVSVAEEFDEVWNVLYDANIPMISSFGNHDWTPPHGYVYMDQTTYTFVEDLGLSQLEHSSNLKTLDFVQKSYERSADLTSDFAYTRFAPPAGSTGPSNYLATFRGVQLAMFQGYAFDDSYTLSGNGLMNPAEEDKGVAYSTFQKVWDHAASYKTTLAVTHAPMWSINSELGAAAKADFLNFMTTAFSRQPALFNGHTHKQKHRSFHSNGKRFIEHTAPYPWYYPDHDPTVHPPGAFAVLVSPANGILQVKRFAVCHTCGGFW